MHAYLLLGSEASVNTKTEEIAQGAKILNFTFAKVADVRELNNFLKYKLTEKTVIVLKNFDRSTNEAQNAFLKALEEPQENLTFVLICENKHKVLPTIQSRCQIIELIINKSNAGLQFTIEEKNKLQKFINADIGQKLLGISKINKREEAIEFMKNLIIVGHEIAINNQFSNSNFQILEAANKTLINLEANGNVQLQLTNFVVSLFKL